MVSTQWVSGQRTADFEQTVQNYQATYLKDSQKMAVITERSKHSCEKDHVATPEEIEARAKEAARHEYIQEHMEEYMNLYFPEKQSASPNTTVTICDNGGFEQDFLHYDGFVSTYTSGSNTCTPNVPGWTPVTMPLANRIEIMTSGVDPLINIQIVKFGNKSLRINNRYGHINQCAGNGGVDRVIKTFEVTAENRRFTVWYAFALENPSGHNDQQPFFSIKCDKAPADELCFAADILKCDKIYPDPCNYLALDVLDWSCHRFEIPSSEIGTIATVEIIAADCGQTDHFGYAYIDGFCESCTGSALGSVQLNGSEFDPKVGIEYYSCDGQTAQVCGTYTLPTLCGNWTVANIIVPGYTIQNLIIDDANKTFCFEFPKSNFGTNDCLDINAQITFNSSLGMNLPPQTSNTIKICKELYKSYSYSVSIGSCNSNGTSDLLSDDYYYVTVNISDPDQNGWTIQRQLLDPYDGESGVYTITSSSGSDQVVLGPFLIQEGCWDIIITLPNCTYTEKICPPEFCSGCDAFAGVEISNVTCIPGPPDTWTFDIFVSGIGTYTINGVTKTKGSKHTISGGVIGQSCLDYELVSGDCTQKIVVCPPVPCSVRNCNLEIYSGKITCTPSGYTVNLHTQNTNLCYYQPGALVSTPVPTSGDIGPFTGDVQVVVFPCGPMPPTCFKMLYFPKPNCNDPNIEITFGRRDGQVRDQLTVVPNPTIGNSIILKTVSGLEDVFDYSIHSVSGQLIQKGTFIGVEQSIPFDASGGVYILKFVSKNGQEGQYKFVKL
ncbi:MAG: T9SS type A sorting domain-containing protein [Saprospiraceae bacterium]